MKRKEHIKKFLRENKYEGRRLRPLMDEREIDFVSIVINTILEKNPKEIFPYQYSDFDPDKDKYVDHAYYRPIEDYLVAFGNYDIVYDIQCPHCRGKFISDKIPSSKISLKEEKKCANCGNAFDLFETNPGLFDIPTSYLDSFDSITKLIYVG